MSLRELHEDWTLCDVLDAHDTLDALEDAQFQAEEKARNEDKRRQRLGGM